MYTLIIVAVVVVVLVVVLSWRGRATAPPTRAGSPRTPRADLTSEAERVDPDEAGS